MHADPPAVYACLPADRHTELAAEVELHRYFGGIDSTAQAREYARIIAGWKPLPMLTQKAPGGSSTKRSPGTTGAKELQTPARITISSADRAEALHCADDRRNPSSDRLSWSLAC